jgi:hypothetical protein
MIFTLYFLLYFSDYLHILWNFKRNLRSERRNRHVWEKRLSEGCVGKEHVKREAGANEQSKNKVSTVQSPPEWNRCNFLVYRLDRATLVVRAPAVCTFVYAPTILSPSLIKIQRNQGVCTIVHSTSLI